MSETDLETGLEMLVESLPAEHDQPNKRANVLTRADAAIIAGMIKIAMSNQGCSIGLDSQQIAALKGTPAETLQAMSGIVKERKQLLNAIGGLTLAILAWLGKLFFEAIDWAKITTFFKGH